MAYSFKEKKTYFNDLRNSEAAKHDIELLKKVQPHHPQLETFTRNPSRYADEILYILLDLSTREQIRENRRTSMAAELESSLKEDKKPIEDNTAQEADERAEEAEKRIQEAEGRAEEAEKRVQEAEERAEESEERAQEADERAEEAEKRVQEAEERAEEAELQLKEEKKKEAASNLPGKSKNTKNIRK